MATSDPLLQHFRTALETVYGDRLESVVLFGSHARGAATPDSDYDIAVFIRGMTSFHVESKKLSKIEIAIARETGVTINSLPFSADLPPPPTILMATIRQEGIAL